MTPRSSHYARITLSWAAKLGPHASSLRQAILQDRHHPKQGYRSCLGLIRLER